MRIDKNIPYGNNFLNDAIDVRINTVGMDRNLNEPNMSYQDKVSKQKMIEESEIAKYILETKQDVEKQASLRGILLNVFDEYSIFVKCER